MKLSQFTFSVAASVAAFAVFEAPARAFSFMPLGDSVTRGFPKADDVEGYRVKLWEKLSAEYNDIEFVGRLTNGAADSPSSAKNHEGWAGFTIDELTNPVVKSNTPGYKVDTFPQYQSIDAALEANSPDVVLLMAGTNDLLTGDDANKALGDLDILIDSIKDQAKVLVSSIVPFDTKGAIVSEEEASNSRTFNSLIPGLADGENVFFADAGGIVSSILDDGFHPTVAGYETLAQGWFDAIKDSSVIPDSLLIAEETGEVEEPTDSTEPVEEVEEPTDSTEPVEEVEEVEEPTDSNEPVEEVEEVEEPPVVVSPGTGNSDVTVPEPTSLAGLLAFGVLGVGATRKRKQKQTAESVSFS